jgi:transcriptional regulator with XRE-family HTH domain
METLRISLKAARINAELSQREAARCLGISISTLQNYESGKTVPDWNMVGKISDLYDLSSDYIFFGKDSA